MYLVITNTENIFCDTAEEVKNISKGEIVKVFLLSETAYDDIASTGDIRDCICSFLKGKQEEKDNVVEWVSEKLSVKKTEVSKVITAMKKEKIIYRVIDMGNYIGIN